MLPILQIGPLAVQLPGLLLILGVWVGSLLAERASARQGISPHHLNNLIFYGLIAAVVGARLGYALRYLPLYLEQPLGLISLNPSTLSAGEGMVAGALMSLVYGRRHGLSLWPTLDALAPGLAGFSLFLGGAHLASGDAFGAPASVPWAIMLWGEARHPTQLYEVVAAAIGLAAALRFSRTETIAGFTFLAWSAIYAAASLLIGGFRGDSLLILGGLRQGQVMAWFALLLALLGLHLNASRASAGSLTVEP